MSAGSGHDRRSGLFFQHRIDSLSCACRTQGMMKMGLEQEYAAFGLVRAEVVKSWRHEPDR